MGGKASGAQTGCFSSVQTDGRRAAHYPAGINCSALLVQRLTKTAYILLPFQSSAWWNAALSHPLTVPRSYFLIVFSRPY